MLATMRMTQHFLMNVEILLGAINSVMIPGLTKFLCCRLSRDCLLVMYIRTPKDDTSRGESSVCLLRPRAHGTARGYSRSSPGVPNKQRRYK